MKKKLREDLQTSSLDKSSDALVESSFSKITFRKRSHLGDSEVMPVIGEEEGFPESLNVANRLDSDGESPAKKKKRKRKNKESISGKVNSTLDSIFSEQVNENYASVDEEFGFDSSVQCDGSDLKRKKRKKKDKHIEEGELSFFSGSKDLGSVDLQAEERLDDSNYSIDPVHNSTQAHSEKKKKHKNKHKPKDFMGDSNLDKEESQDQQSNDLEVSVNTVSPVKAKKSKRSKSMIKANDNSFSQSFKKDFDKNVETINNKNPFKVHESVNATFSSPLLGKKKKTKNLVDESCLQEKSVVDNNVSVVSLDGDANLSPKKKRKSNLLDEIGFILSNSDHMERKNEIKEDRGENNECLPGNSETMVSAKKLKRKSKSPKKILSVHEDSLRMDSEICDHKLTSKTEMSHDKKQMFLGESNSECEESVRNNPVNEINCTKPLENSFKIKKTSNKLTNHINLGSNSLLEEDILPAREIENKKIKNIAKDFCSKGSLEKTNKKKKKKRNFDDIEAIQTQLLAQAFSNVKESANDSKKFSKPEKGVSSKKQLLQEAITCLETSEGAELKSHNETSPKTMAKETPDDLRKRLLSEALSVKQNIKDKPLKSKKPKTGGMDNADAGVTNKVHKSGGKLLKKPVSLVEKNYKNKHSVKSDDLDKLTDVLISKALEKLSSSGASHSSQENINCLNTKKNSVWGKPSFEKDARDNKAKAKLVSKAQINDERKLEVKDIESKDEREEIKRALLNSALKQLKSRAKASDSKKKQEPH